MAASITSVCIFLVTGFLALFSNGLMVSLFFFYLHPLVDSAPDGLLVLPLLDLHGLYMPVAQRIM